MINALAWTIRLGLGEGAAGRIVLISDAASALLEPLSSTRTACRTSAAAKM
jgi:hypothetical protein